MGDEHASAPRTAHEFSDELLALRILYLRIEERADGFFWQVRLHRASDPIASGTISYGSQNAARTAGQAALNKACGEFRAFKGFG